MLDVTVKQTDPMTVAFLSVQGPYEMIPEAFGRLYGRLQAEGLMPTGAPHAVFHSDPTEVPEDRAAWELWAPVMPDTPPADRNAEGWGVKQIEPMTVVSALNRGAYDTVGDTYAQLAKWIAHEGYEIVGPPMESYLNSPDDVAEEDLLTEVDFPVSRR